MTETMPTQLYPGRMGGLGVEMGQLGRGIGKLGNGIRTRGVGVAKIKELKWGMRDDGIGV